MEDATIEDIIGLFVPRITASLSILAAVATAMETAADHREGIGTVVSRTQFFLQLPLIIFCCAIATGSIAVPMYRQDILGAAGNDATCKTQGFFIQLSALAYSLFDMAISSYFVLIVRYGWSEDRLKKLEKAVHVIVWPFALLISFLFLSFDMFGPDTDSHLCWLTFETTVSYVMGAAVYMTAFIANAYAIYAMATIFLFVRKIENSIRKYDFPGAATSPAGVSRARSRATGIQGMLYAGSTLACNALLILDTWMHFFKGTWLPQFLPISGLTFIGVLNMLVNFRKRPALRTKYAYCVQSFFSFGNCRYCCYRRIDTSVKSKDKNRRTFVATASSNTQAVSQSDTSYSETQSFRPTTSSNMQQGSPSTLHVKYLTKPVGRFGSARTSVHSIQQRSPSLTLGDLSSTDLELPSRFRPTRNSVSRRNPSLTLADLSASADAVADQLKAVEEIEEMYSRTLSSSLQSGGFLGLEELASASLNQSRAMMSFHGNMSMPIQEEVPEMDCIYEDGSETDEALMDAAFQHIEYIHEESDSETEEVTENECIHENAVEEESVTDRGSAEWHLLYEEKPDLHCVDENTTGSEDDADVAESESIMTSDCSCDERSRQAMESISAESENGSA